jgi:hypothetical protein
MTERDNERDIAIIAMVERAMGEAVKILRSEDERAAEVHHLRSIVAAREADLSEVLSALDSMVWQYCSSLDDTSVSHDFMSAGEEAFGVLEKHGMLELSENMRYVKPNKDGEK